MVTVFKNGQVFIQQKPDAGTVWDTSIDYWQYLLPTEAFFEQLLDAISWLPPNYIRPDSETAGLTVAQLLAWPEQEHATVSPEQFTQVQAKVLAGSWAALTREEQLLHEVGKGRVLVEMVYACRQQTRKLVSHLSHQLEEALKKLRSRDDLAA